MPSLSLSSPIVRVRARFAAGWGAWGSGFLIGEWPSSVITARHVVALSDGKAPTDVVVQGLSGSKWINLGAGVVAFWEGGLEAPDVAIVRVLARIASPLQMGSLAGSTSAEIWGYPLGVGRAAPKSHAVVATEATNASDWLVLSTQARVGMSGGAVVSLASEGSTAFAIGIYLGPEDGGTARAFVLDSSAIKDAKDAAMNLP